MAFCRACGQDAGDATFCPKCGAAQSAPQVPSQSAPQFAPQSASPGGASAPAAASATEGIAENVAGLLCYVFGWLSGLIFLLIDKRPFVKFHAIQSIALNIACVAIMIVFWIIVAIAAAVTLLIFHFPIGGLLGFLMPVIGLGFFALFIYCMVKAYQHEKFKVPIIGNMVEKWAA